MKQYDYLIVGAGLYGAVFAQEAKKAGKKCLVIDKRGHIAGNIYTEQVEPGSDNPYINILAVRTADLENETYKKVLEAYQSPETAKAIEDLFKGTYIPAFEY